MTYRLLMLGPPTLVRGADAVVLKSRKGQALLWYLAAQPTAFFIREHLHGLLWDDVPSDAARRDFNTMLSRLRTELPVNCFHGPRGQLGWNPNLGISTDVADFLRWTDHVESGQGPPPIHSIETQEQKNRLHRAVALWRGLFLDGFSCDSAAYEEWIIAERQRWEMRMLTTLTALVAAEKADGCWQQVAAVAQRALQIDPLQEPFHRALMEAQFHQGNRPAALAQFELCRRTLREQLSTEPDAMTTTLFETIKASAGPMPGEIALSMTAASSEAHDGTVLHQEAAVPHRIIPDHLRGITGSMPPLIGRHREYTQVTDALRRTVHRGQSHIVLLRGEAGIGKTRLFSEIMDAAAAGGLTDTGFSTLLVGRAYESMLGVPYTVFVDVLDPVLPAVDLSAINLPDVWLRELGRLLPDVFVHRPDLDPPEPMESGDDRLRLFQAVARLLSGLPQPVLLAVDDLQWADSLTVSLLAYLLRHPSSHLSVAAVVTVRTGDDSDSLQLMLSTLEREGRLTRVELTNLTKDDTFTLVETMFPNGGPEQAARVHSHSLGHPLHTVELMSMLVDRGGNFGNESAPLPVPPTVHDVFIGRLARLGDVAMNVADALALFRRGATLDQLLRATQLPEGDIVEAVLALTRAFIVSENGHGTVSFKHDVYRQVVQEKLSLARLTHLHRQAYAALTEESTSEASSFETMDQQLLADLITHSMGGQMWEEAVRWTRQAAAVAERLYAFPAAVEHLNMTLVCLDKLPASDTRRKQRLDIELHVAKLDTWSPPDERDARLAAVAELARNCGATQYLPLIHMAQADSLILQGRCLEADVLLEQLAPMAAQDPRLALGLIAWRGAIDAVVGNVKPALAHLRTVQEAMGEQVLKPGTSVYAGIAACHAAAREFDQADAALAVMEQEEKQQGYQSLTSKYLSVAATVEYLRGRWSEAAGYARQGLLTSRAAEDSANEALSALWLGAATLELGAGSHEPNAVTHEPDHAQEAVQALEDALAASKRAQSYTRRDFIYAFLALAYSQTGQHTKADMAIRTGLRLVERFGYMEGRALGREVQGRMAATRGNLEPARHHLVNALTQFEALGNAAGAYRCRRHLAALDRQSLAARLSGQLGKTSYQ